MWGKHDLVEQTTLLNYSDINKDKIDENVSEIEEIWNKFR